MATVATGTVFNVQRYSIHDGPGIRTTVFLKGCPLRCLWCHNPESQEPQPEVVYLESRCMGCGACVEACPNRALRPVEQDAARTRGNREQRMIGRDRARCSACGACVGACSAGAREIAGKVMPVDEVMVEVLKDRVFYEQSGGGVTFSGGEPLMQPGFLRDLLTRCKEEGLATTVDTSGFSPWDDLGPVIPLVDVFLYDVKLMDDERHQRYTGVSNRPILENLARLASVAEGLDKTVIVRIPLVPGINDDEQNIRSTGEFLRNTGVGQVAVLPYHHLGADKYRRLGRDYTLPGQAPPSAGALQRAVDILAGFGLSVKAGE